MWRSRRLTFGMGSRSIATDSMARREALDCIAALVSGEYAVEVKTSYGMWRLVVAVYSDESLGTIRAGSAAPGRFTLLRMDQIARIRACLPGLQRRNLPSDGHAIR